MGGDWVSFLASACSAGNWSCNTPVGHRTFNSVNCIEFFVHLVSLQQHITNIKYISGLIRDKCQLVINRVK